ncbi:MAG: hypothetical protein AB7F88_18855 [Pyrinomonadaceae bacterium]
MESDPTKCWKQTFVYDRYGNRTFDTTLNRTTTIPTGCPVAVCNPSADTTNNKLVGYQFDAAGNTKQDAESRKFTYDAENKQVKVETVDASGNPVSTIGEYHYDGDGKRVNKDISLPLVAKTFWFIRWTVLLLWASIWIAFLVKYFGNVGPLLSAGWAINALLLLLGFFLPVHGIIRMFFSRTVFAECYIESVSGLGTTRRYAYDEIEKVETANTGHLLITFNNGETVKVWSGQANLNRVNAILRAKTLGRSKAEMV